jgi:hypothetical protein
LPLSAAEYTIDHFFASQRLTAAER